MTKQMANYPHALFIAKGNGYVKMYTTDILYVKAAGDYCVLFTNTGEHLSSLGIGQIATCFDPAKFIRIHRSFIVNLYFVQGFYRKAGRTCVLLENGYKINVSRQYFEILKQLII